MDLEKTREVIIVECRLTHDKVPVIQNRSKIFLETTVPSRENGFSRKWFFLANGTTFLTFHTSSKLEKWIFQKMGRLDDREENGTLTNLRESFVTFENRGL